MNPEMDINGLIRKDIKRKRKKAKKHQEISFREYLGLIEDDPAIAQNSYARALEIILEKGVEEIPIHEQWLSIDKRYPFFTDELFGVDRTIAQIMDYIEAGANRAITGKKVLLLVGPPGSGKSTKVRILKQGFEAYQKRPVFVIKGCPKFEEPLHLIPRNLRKEVEEKLKVKIEGDLCHICRDNLLSNFKDDNGSVRWWDVLVETFTFSIQGVRGLTSFEPSGEKSADITTLTGRENVSVTSIHGYDHPRAYEISGEIPKAERGVCEGRELTSSDPDVLGVFFSVAEERELKITGSSFPHLSVDTIVIGHTNLTPYKDFAANKKYEGLHRRFYIIMDPYPLRIQDEVRIYKKLIAGESALVQLEHDPEHLRKCHIAPGAIELAATFAVLTRLVESQKGTELLTKAKIYNGEVLLTELEDRDTRPKDINELLDEGQENADIAKREGMFGVCASDVITALDTALVQQSGRKKCLTPLTVIRALRDFFKESHRMGYSPEEIEGFMGILSAGEKESVMTEYRQYVVNTVSRAFLKAYKPLAEDLFKRYVQEAEFYRRTKRKFAAGQILKVERDPISGKPKEPKTKFLRDIEQHIPWTEEEAEVGRGEILEIKATDPDFSYDSYPPLAKAVERKLLSDSKALLTAILATDKPLGEEEKHRIEDLFGSLDERGHCEVCAHEIVEQASEFLSE